MNGADLWVEPGDPLWRVVVATRSLLRLGRVVTVFPDASGMTAIIATPACAQHATLRVEEPGATTSIVAPGMDLPSDDTYVDVELLDGSIVTSRELLPTTLAAQAAGRLALGQSLNGRLTAIRTTM